MLRFRCAKDPRGTQITASTCKHWIASTRMALWSRFCKEATILAAERTLTLRRLDLWLRCAEPVQAGWGSGSETMHRGGLVQVTEGEWTKVINQIRILSVAAAHSYKMTISFSFFLLSFPPSISIEKLSGNSKLCLPYVSKYTTMEA